MHGLGSTETDVLLFLATNVATLYFASVCTLYGAVM